MQKVSKSRLAQPMAPVKRKIIAAGIDSLGDVAALARITPATLSNYMAGRVRSRHIQHRITRAVNTLTGMRYTSRRLCCGVRQRP